MLRLRIFLPVLLLLLPLIARAGGVPLVDLQGRSAQLADHTGQGQWTVVMLWDSSCGVCHAEAPHVQAFHDKHRGDAVRVLGISVDEPAGLADTRDFVAEHGLSFPNLVGTREDVALLFHDHTGAHLVGTPAFLVFNPRGELRTYELGTLNLAVLEAFIQQQSRVAIAERNP